MFAPLPGTPAPATTLAGCGPSTQQRPAAMAHSTAARGLDRQCRSGAGVVATVPARQGLGIAVVGQLGGISRSLQGKEINDAGINSRLPEQ
jgi:hypothetical protein